MKLIKSQLELVDFFILDTNYKFIDPIENSDVKIFFSNYELDFDFMPRYDNGQYFVYIKIGINRVEAPLPGYSLFVEGVCVFNFSDQNQISTDLKSEFIWNSGLSIAINSLRNYISNITVYYPFGKYILPGVDLTSAINEKRKQLEDNKKETNVKIKKTKKG
jgi:hypothetical protein